MTVYKEPTKPTKAVSYYRVSTARQGASGLGLEAQRASVTAYAKANGLAIVSEFTEIETGTRKKKRKVIYKELAAAKACDGVLLIAKLDRLARNVVFISTLMESGAPFVCVDFPQVTNLTLHILAAVAEEEARMISARTKAALKRAKARGTKLGAPQSDASRAQLAEAATISAATKHEDAKANGLAIVAEFTEIETGTRKKKRKEIYKALAAAKACGGVLLIAKLDRLARNVAFISALMESGTPFVCVDLPQVTPLTLHILSLIHI